jgi:hypothetical protein
MKNLSISTKIYFGLIVLFASLTSFNIFLPQGDIVEQLGAQLPASKPVMAVVVFFITLILYGSLGFIGLKLSKKLGFAELWDEKVSNRQRFLNPLIIGVIVGLFFIITDLIFTKISGITLPHPPFPTSLFASISAAIGEEVLFRLFFISFWVWLISNVILKKRWQNQVFWIIVFFSAIGFAFGHIPSMMMVVGFEAMSQIPIALYAELIILNGVVAVVAAYYFRKHGILAAIGIHFWLDIVWHVIYGLF